MANVPNAPYRQPLPLPPTTYPPPSATFPGMAYPQMGAPPAAPAGYTVLNGLLTPPASPAGGIRVYDALHTGVIKVNLARSLSRQLERFANMLSHPAVSPPVPSMVVDVLEWGLLHVTVVGAHGGRAFVTVHDVLSQVAGALQEPADEAYVGRFSPDARRYARSNPQLRRVDMLGPCTMTGGLEIGFDSKGSVRYLLRLTQ
ncbi:hypothetical protein BKA93DRAFT_828670 [Sparassis latifolia]